MSNGDPIIEDEATRAKAEAVTAEKRLKQKLSQPGAEVRYMAAPSTAIEEMPYDWFAGVVLPKEV